MRLHSTLQALQVQLSTHLAYLRTLRANTESAQSSRAARKAQTTDREKDHRGYEPSQLGAPRTRSYWSFEADPDARRKEELKRRVEEGRARGWKMERFDAERYQRLAAVAMEELGV